MPVVTWFSGLTEPRGRSESVSWPELWGVLDAAGTEAYRGDKVQPGWSPAEFSGDKRAKDGVVNVCAVGLDFDGGALTLAQVHERLSPFLGYVHTTRSHTASKPRCRAIVALSRPVNAVEYERCWQALAEGMDGHVDKATKDASRFWFMPSLPIDDGPDGAPFQSAYMMGKPANVEAMLAATEPLPNPEPVRHAVGASGDPARASAEAWMVKAFTKVAMAGKGERNAALNAAACMMYGKSEYVRLIGDSAIQAELSAIASRVGLEPEEIRKTLASGRAAGMAKPIADSPRPEPASLVGTRQGLHLVTAATPEAKPLPTIAWKYGSDLAEPLPPTRWVVGGLQIGPGRPNVVMGYGASAKTLALQSMALSVAAGLPVWGHYASVQGVVRHLDYEQGNNPTTKRYQRMAYALGIDLRALGTAIGMAPLPDVKLNSPGAYDEFARVCQDADLVILDSIKAATPGINENDSVIRECIDILTKVSEVTGAAFVMIHHSGKPKPGDSDARTIGRGSSAIFDAAGSQFNITPGLLPSDPRRVHQTKQSADAEGAGVPDFALALQDVASSESPTAGLRVLRREVELDEPRTDAKAAKADTLFISHCASIHRWLRDNPGASARDIASGSAVNSPNRVKAALARLVEDGLVEVDRTLGFERYGSAP